MNKEEFRENQPVAWRVLSHALKSGRLSHAYLFYGPKGSPVSETAVLFAQSLFCEEPDEDGFACGKCSSCLAVKEERFPDYFRLAPGGLHSGRPLKRKDIEQYWKSGGEISLNSPRDISYVIRKEQIASLQDFFSQSASNDSSRQVYILEKYDKATPSASNALLKFLEEPQPGITGILTTHEPAAILPTILSRTQMIALRPAGRTLRKAQISELIDDEEAAQMLAEGGWDKEDAARFLEENHFFAMQEAARILLQNRASHSSIVRLQREIFPAKSRDFDRMDLQLFFEWVSFYARQSLNRSQDEKMSGLKITLDSRQALAVLQICLESIDTLRYPADPALLLDQFCFRLRKEME